MRCTNLYNWIILTIFAAIHADDGTNYLSIMKTDIQIARECELKPIGDIAAQLGIAPEKIEPYGRYMAKVPVSLINEEKVRQSPSRTSRPFSIILNQIPVPSG